MISVDAVRNNYMIDKENVRSNMLGLQNIFDFKDGDALMDDTSHRDLTIVDKELISGISCEGDASACTNHNQNKGSNEAKVSENR